MSFADTLNSVFEPLNDWWAAQNIGMDFDGNGAFTDGYLGATNASQGMDMDLLDDAGQLWLWAPDSQALTDQF